MTQTTEIPLSVLMPVYNCEKYLKKAIESILSQTYSNFEFLIINDGSTDHSEEIIKSYSDPRITYVSNKKNQGIVKTLNKGIDLSKGKYIARMDADDIALPNRLQEQIQFMQTHPEYKVCGSWAITIKDEGDKAYKMRRPLLSDDIKVEHLFRNSFIHPSVILDAETVKKLKYSADYQYAEDYFLFSQIALKYKVANLKSPLLLYRTHTENITTSKQAEMRLSEKKTIHYILSYLTESEVSEESIAIHHSFLRRTFDGITSNKVENHLLRIKNANKIKQVYHQKTLEKMLQKEWFNFLFFGPEKKPLSKFVKSELFSIKHFSFKQLKKLVFKK